MQSTGRGFPSRSTSQESQGDSQNGAAGPRPPSAGPQKLAPVRPFGAAPKGPTQPHSSNGDAARMEAASHPPPSAPGQKPPGLNRLPPGRAAGAPGGPQSGPFRPLMPQPPPGSQASGGPQAPPQPAGPPALQRQWSGSSAASQGSASASRPSGPIRPFAMAAPPGMGVGPPPPARQPPSALGLPQAGPPLSRQPSAAASQPPQALPGAFQAPFSARPPPGHLPAAPAQSSFPHSQPQRPLYAPGQPPQPQGHPSAPPSAPGPPRFTPGQPPQPASTPGQPPRPAFAPGGAPAYPPGSLPAPSSRPPAVGPMGQQPGVQQQPAPAYPPGPPPAPSFRPPAVGPMGQQPGAQQQPASPAGSRRTSVTGAPLPPAGPASSRQLKVDEQQMPRPAGDKAAAPKEFFTRTSAANNTVRHANPPSASSAFVVRDAGNCSPRHMRCTLNAVPGAWDLLKQSCIPFAVVVQPLAEAKPGDDLVQLVDMGPNGPLRCSGCGAYMNPYMQWSNDGATFTCNLCRASNPTPPEYRENTGPDGRRRDADVRPELCKGSVDFLASSPVYAVRAPMLPTHLFLIDVSYHAVTSGAAAAACSAVAESLSCLQGGDRARVGVMTYDSALHFYTLRPEQAHPHLLVVPDTEDPYCPAPQALLAPLGAVRAMVVDLLERIPGMYAATQTIDSCAGAAIHAAIDTLKAVGGGKLQVLLGSLPRSGAHALAARDGNAGPKTAMSLMQPQGKDYDSLADAAAEAQVCIDLFVMSSSYVDVATLSRLCHPTAGQLYHYCPWVPEIDASRVANDLRWNLYRPQGWEAIARLRLSLGLEVETHLGGAFRRSTTDLEFPAVHSDHALAIMLRHAANISSQTEAHLQFAMLYSTPSGQRCIRVHNLALPIANLLGGVFRCADLDATLNLSAHRVALDAPGSSPKASAEVATKLCVDILVAYRKHCVTNTRAGQLILPEPLQLLPIFTLGLMKCPALRPHCTADTRAAWLARLSTAPCDRICALLWPRLIPLAPLVQNPPEGEVESLPTPVSTLSARVLEASGIYLMENGVTSILHFGPEVPGNLIEALLGVPEVPRMDPTSPQTPPSLPVLDNPASRAVHAVLDLVQRERGTWLAPRIARLHSPEVADFQISLVEDNTQAGQSYMEFLCAVHQKIQNSVS